MAQFCGTWNLTISEEKDLEKYMRAVCVSDENIEQGKKALAAGAKLSQVISRDGTTWKVKVVTPAGEKEQDYPEGQAVSVSTLDGRVAQTTYTLEGDGLVETQKGDGWESRNVRTVDGNVMSMTFTAGNGVSCVRKYEKQD